MQKKKRWHLVLILTVIALTFYNILPTLFFYTKPLSSPVSEPYANKLSIELIDRINSLEKSSIQWMQSFCKLLKIKPQSITIDPSTPQTISVVCRSETDAKVLRKYLVRAGALIPFVPAQLTPAGTPSDFDNKTVQVQRNIAVHFDPNLVESYFQFSTKKDDQGNITPLYQALVEDRTKEIALAIGGTSENAQFVDALCASQDSALNLELALLIGENLSSFIKTFGDASPIAKRYFASFIDEASINKKEAIDTLLTKLDACIANLSDEIQALSKTKEEGKYLDSTQAQLKNSLSDRIHLLQSAVGAIKKNKESFLKSSQSWTDSTIRPYLQESFLTSQTTGGVQTLSLAEKNAFIESMQVDWNNEQIILTPYADLIELQTNASEKNGKQKEVIEQFIFNELAYVSRKTDETILPFQKKYRIALSELQGSSSFLALKLKPIAEAEMRNIKRALVSSWSPKHTDLQPEAFPVLDYEEYMQLPKDQTRLSLVIYSPATQNRSALPGFRMNSIYVIAKGMDKIIKKMQSDPSSAESQTFLQDFYALKSLLNRAGYMGYEGSILTTGKEFAGDFIFEISDYFQNVLSASRENFFVKGSKKFGILEFTNVEQRILTENKIDTEIHEDLLKWRDDYVSAQLSIKGVSRFDVPKPTQNVLLSNLKLSAIKYFRGDDRKILRWGLDLSGGKTVLIELRDSNNRLVTNEADIKQGINELYSRVNKMGVSEVSIRQEGSFINLDFPGSQNLSAADLVKASSMFFHVVYEKFTPNNPALASHVNKFLQEVWNEAVITNRKEPEDINRIALRHLYGETLNPDSYQPRSEAARALYENGLRLSPEEINASNLFDDTYAKISILRGNDYSQWQGQTHPLLIVFKNFALEGSDLENVHASYDPSRGNFLSFGVRGSYTNKEGVKLNPRDNFAAWTTPFSKEKVAATNNGHFSHNQGWRMAVVLNGTVVSSPTLDSPLRDSAMITGSFSQREINQLEADLKAGSLTFSPKILSEQNVSPELGAKERSMGILATVFALILVIAVMIGYYKLGGVVASVAVIFNLLLMWATLQNIHATLTLASLAGLILTVGMAVDANVLVFERIREEFALTGRITAAVHAGYKKAFSAILDSNITTIIAALVLLQFHSGPVKGFALTLIIGILSSMFTALFMTRYFFSLWVQNPKNTSLRMLNWFKAKKFNFLRYAKVSMVISLITIALGALLFSVEKHSLFGMDFTGGYAFNLELAPKQNISYRQVVEKALIANGVKPQELQVRELSPSNQVRIFLSRTLDNPGRPFSQMNSSSTDIPQISWVISSLQNAHVELAENSVIDAKQNWSDVSGQMSQAMRNSAIIGLAIALFFIFIYITIRFEFKYAIAATLCLLHDLLFTFAAIALLHALGVPLQVDLSIVAALLTIAGYSLNDTIIVFDRIREETKSMRNPHLVELINHALNVTLSRTILTSGTTLLVLIPLIAMGGSTIFGFSLVMGIGVVFGTLSSLFIAAPLMLFFHKKEQSKQQKIALNS
jgi:SecD/SecF fusion protein